MNVSSIKNLVFKKTLSTYPIIIVCSGIRNPIHSLRNTEYKTIYNIKYVDSTTIDINDLDSEYKFVFFAEVKGIDETYVKDFITVTLAALKCEVVNIVGI